MSGSPLPPELLPIVTNIEGVPAWTPAVAPLAVELLAAAGRAPLQAQAWIYLIKPDGEFTYTHIIGVGPEVARIYEWAISSDRDAAVESWSAFCTRAGTEAATWLRACTAPTDVPQQWRERLVFAVWFAEEG